MPPRSRLLALFAALLLTHCAAARPAFTRSPYDLVLRDLSGERFDLARLGGRVVLVTFFATWCFPCLVEQPSLAALHERFSGRGFSVVAVGMDLEGRKVLAPFVEAQRVPYPVLLADDEVRSGRSPYGPIPALPTTFLLDRTGKLVAAYEGPADPKALAELVDRLTR